MTDVWDLAKKDNGDHVIIALTIPECQALLAMDGEPGQIGRESQQALFAAQRQIRLGLRDLKGIDDPYGDLTNGP